MFRRWKLRHGGRFVDASTAERARRYVYLRLDRLLASAYVDGAGSSARGTGKLNESRQAGSGSMAFVH